MELIPLLIIGIGIVSSIIGSKNNKEKEGERNIDTSKLDRRQNTAPRERQAERDTRTNEQKGFFQTLQEAFDEEFNQQEKRTDPKPEQTKPAASSSRDMTSNRRPERQAVERPVRETIQKARERTNTSQNISDIEKRITDRSKHAKRASEAKESVYTEGYNKRAARSEGLGRDIADEVRYSYGDDVTQMHKRGKNNESDTSVTADDLTFDSKSFVNGIIMSEILGKPKSRQKTDRKLG